MAGRETRRRSDKRVISFTSSSMRLSTEVNLSFSSVRKLSMASLLLATSVST